MQATQNYIKKQEIPYLFYTNHSSVFYVNLHNAENEKKTQWKRIIAQLGIKAIHAIVLKQRDVLNVVIRPSDRLIKEMRLA